MIYKFNNQPFDITIEHLIGDVNYPRNWFQDATNRAAIGIQEFPEPAPTPPSIPEAAASAQMLVDMGYDSAISAITSTYPATEIASWPKQEDEARAYIVNNSTPTPLLTALATARGVTVSDIAARVIAKADAYVGIAGALIGRRQARQDAIAVAVANSDLAALQSVVW